MDPYILDVIRLLDFLTKIVLGLLGAWVSWLLYKNNIRQRSDSWLKQFNELHQLFWTDSAMSEVRSWIACDEAYSSVEAILAKRRRIKENQSRSTTEQITIEEYVILEKLDKFCNLMVRVISLNPDTKEHERMIKDLFFLYWVSAIRDETKRPDLHWYVSTFYVKLAKHGNNKAV